MKKEVMKEWVKALRSGKYIQGRGVLKFNNTYCCLGLLCEISGKEYDGAQSVVPSTVTEWSGLKTNVGIYDKLAPALYTLNDCYMMPFDKIADIIEKNWKEL